MNKNNYLTKTASDLGKTILGLGCVGIMALTQGCATNKYQMPYNAARDNSAVMQETTSSMNPKYFQLTQEKLDNATDLIQKMGESGAIEGFTFPSAYSLPGLNEETREKIAMEVASRYTPMQIAHMVTRFGESKLEKEMRRWQKDALIKDVTSTLFWSAVLSTINASSGSNSSNEIGGGSSNDIGGTVTSTSNMESGVGRGIRGWAP
jgi:hypothetical protein